MRAPIPQRFTPNFPLQPWRGHTPGRLPKSNKAEFDDGFLTSGSIKSWAESKSIHTSTAANTFVTDLPYAGYWGVNFYFYPSGTWRVLIATDIQCNKQYFIVKNAELPWSEWQQIATATPPMEYDLPLVAGVVNIPGGYQSTYSKDQFGKVIINLFLDRADGSAFKTWHEVLANLPTGYRPTQNVNVVGVATSNASSSPIGFSVLPDGTIRIYPFSVTETRVTATFVFQAGN